VWGLEALARCSIEKAWIASRNAGDEVILLSFAKLKHTERTVVSTIAELFYEACSKGLPDALAFKKDGVFQPISHLEVIARVERLALALRARGLQTGDHVAIIAENRPEWPILDYACAISGMPSVPVYPTLNGPQTAYVLRNSESKWVVCSTADHARKVLEQKEGLPKLECVVIMDEGPKPDSPLVLQWSKLLDEGEALEDRRDEVREWAKARKPEELLTLIYTSGTTGDPKGTMLSHRNLVSNILDSARILPFKDGDKALSFLPLSHILERMAGQYALMYIGASIYYAENINTVSEDLVTVQPTVMVAVPRIFEKIHARVREGVASASPLKRFIFNWAMLSGKLALPYLYEDQPIPLWIRFQLWFSRHLVFDKILARTGGRMKYAVSGGAPLAGMLMEFFWSIGLKVIEGYGLTETSPVISFNRTGGVAPGKVGHPLYDSWEGKPFVVIAADGEILCQGPNVMLGYWKNDKATAECIDADGYFHTGDIGEFDDRGRLKITDRKKELIVTSGGKNVAPQPIEERLKVDKYISQAVLIGDKRNFISALIVPNFDSLNRWAGLKGLDCSDPKELVAKPEVHAKLMQRIELVNAQLSPYERIKKITLLPTELTLDGGHLTPSLKVKRRVVNQAFADRIEAMYAEAKA
jgi:long-chain acyl-CoA synthetase